LIHSKIAAFRIDLLSMGCQARCFLSLNQIKQAGVEKEIKGVDRTMRDKRIPFDSAMKTNYQASV